MRIATWNVNSLRARMSRLEAWVDVHQPDILCLQETKLADHEFPHMASPRSGTRRARGGADGGVAWPSRAGAASNVPYGGSATSPASCRR